MTQQPSGGTALPPVRFVGHSSVLLELDGVRILTDPVLRQRIWQIHRVHPPVPRAQYTDLDVVLLSHLHADHFHLPSLRMIDPAVPLVVPAGAAAFLARRRVRRGEVIELGPGESCVVRGVTVTATYAEHTGRRSRFDKYAAPAVGYVVEAGGRRAYFAGDTDLFPGMADLGDAGLDLALVPVWGWGPTCGPGHLDPARAVEAVRMLRPAYAVPIHWGTFVPYGMKHTLMRELLVQPPLDFARGVGELDVPTRVLVTQPGHEVQIN